MLLWECCLMETFKYHFIFLFSLLITNKITLGNLMINSLKALSMSIKTPLILPETCHSLFYCKLILDFISQNFIGVPYEDAEDVGINANMHIKSALYFAQN